MKFAVIPARGGSKRIPDKNIRSFCGKPMIARSIEAAIESQCFEKVIVSTDSRKIAHIALRYGAHVPFIRPAELADDYTGTNAVMRHSVEWLQQNYSELHSICCIYATAPFVSPSDLVRGMTALVNKKSEYAFSVTPFSFPIQRAVRINDGRVEMINQKLFNARSQDLELTYHDAAQFYWGTVQAWLQEKPVFNSNAVPVMLPGYRVQDIDTMEDWVRAEMMYKTHLLMQEQDAV